MPEHESLRAIVSRLAPRYEPDCWLGLVVKVVSAAQTTRDGEIERTPDHFLVAAWPPPRQSPSRWPDVVAIGSPNTERALAELFVHLPRDASLYLAGPDMLDAALAAEILLATDRNLEAYQRAGIAAFIEAERERTRAHITALYSDRDAGFERFTAKLLSPDRTRS